VNASTGSDEIALTPEVMLRAYSVGIFPMAQSAEDDRLVWFDPDPRGILPLDRFHLSQRMARTVRTTPFRVTADKAFADVIDGCAGGDDDRPSTWINGKIRALCLDLHRAGYAHSVEVWDGDALVGGLYGVALHGAFFGESMFSRARDASKIALVHLVARLIHGGFTLLDIQFVTDHLAQFGAVEIPRQIYRRRLAQALQVQGDFQRLGATGGGGGAGGVGTEGAAPGAGEIDPATVVSLVQSTTQIS
jgi:leucyl/phenylalanyl-tRNA--protein transferase